MKERKLEKNRTMAAAKYELVPPLSLRGSDWAHWVSQTGYREYWIGYVKKQLEGRSFSDESRLEIMYWATLSILGEPVKLEMVRPVQRHLRMEEKYHYLQTHPLTKDLTEQMHDVILYQTGHSEFDQQMIQQYIAFGFSPDELAVEAYLQGGQGHLIQFLFETYVLTDFHRLRRVLKQKNDFSRYQYYFPLSQR